MERISRRTVLASSAAGAFALTSAAAARPTGGATGEIRLLSSTDGINTPPKGRGVQKFSFSNPEPSVEFGGLLFGFQVISFENNYGLDPDKIRVERAGDRLTLTCGGYRWAGGQQTRDGRLQAELRLTTGPTIEWTVTASLGLPIKAIKTIVRGLPRGRLSVAADNWRDFGDDEKVFEYPALMGGMATPFTAIEGKDGRFWGLSAIQTKVRPARFAFLPGADGYKVELIYEQAGWDRRGDVTSHVWRIAARSDFDAVAAQHFASVEKNWAIPDFATRADAPEWMKHLALVLSLHGEHWTGYMFNSFDRQLEILRWAADKIDPRNVMVFLAGWDGRYYWDYPQFEVGVRPGGEAAFARLVAEAKKLGYRVALMFGSNVANPAWSGYPTIAGAAVDTLFGAPMPSDYVDWDNDRKGEPTMVFMNLAVQSWREHLKGRISAMIGRYGIDAYFLDIFGFWENNSIADMFEGQRALVHELAAIHPGAPAISEMNYDAQMAFSPMNHVARYPLYPRASFGKVASFGHLSTPAPGRGATGVHEYGFNTYVPAKLDQPQIPTITFVDDTLDRYRALVLTDISTARSRFAARGART